MAIPKLQKPARAILQEAKRLVPQVVKFKNEHDMHMNDPAVKPLVKRVNKIAAAVRRLHEIMLGELGGHWGLPVWKLVKDLKKDFRYLKSRECGASCIPQVWPKVIKNLTELEKIFTKLSWN